MNKNQYKFFKNFEKVVTKAKIKGRNGKFYYRNIYKNNNSKFLFVEINGYSQSVEFIPKLNYYVVVY